MVITKRHLFFDIDTQYDFIMPDGKLYVPGAETIRNTYRDLTQHAIKNHIPVFASADSHEINDPEFADFPPHCISNTPGNRKIPETHIPGAVVQSFAGPKVTVDFKKIPAVIFTKQNLDVFTNPYIDSFLEQVEAQLVILYGVTTEYCVHRAAEGLLNRNLPVHLVVDAIKPVDAKQGEKSLAFLNTRGIEFVTTAEIFAGKI